MYLQALEINGFKSFADKTRLVFEPGITAIVGPNGCGKSNVSDAIRWVLGEQRASALRGGAMTDVIFNGTDARKPLGMAEVSITFADCGGALGLEYDEVTVTRRVFRTGEGQYFINRTPCRLRDIQRLFMDTGIGTTSYSVMAQGQIDAILSSRPEDRRAIFEEASGITRFRADRREALRKLDATDHNLARLADVIAELRRQISSLQRQASRARRFKELQGELRRIDLFLCSKRLTALDERDAALAEAFDREDARSRALRESVDGAEGALEKLRRAVAETENAISEAVEKAAAARNFRAQADEKLRAGALRAAENRAWRERDEVELSQTLALRDAQSSLLADISANLEPLAAAAAAAQEQLEKARADFDAKRASSESSRGELQRLRDQSVELERSIARLRDELSAAEAADRDSVLRHERLDSEKKRLEETVRDLQARLDDASGESETLQSLAETGAEAVQEAERKLFASRAERDEARDAAAAVRTRLAACEARLKLLEDAARSSDGLPAGAAALLDPANPLGVPEGAVLGQLADRISAPRELRTALQAVLRAWLDAVAVRSAQDAASIAATLAGKPASLVPSGGHGGGAVAAGAPPAPGARPLLSLLHVAEGFEGAAARLLSGVWLVDELPSDVSAVPDGLAFVTPDGTVLRAGALFDVRGPDSGAANPFSRHDQLVDARSEAESLTTSADAAEEAERAAQDAIRSAEDALSGARTRLDQARRAAARKEGEERALARDLSDAKARRKAVSAELETLEGTARAAGDRARSLAARLTEASSGRNALADAIAARSDAARASESDFLAAQGALTDARLAHAAASQNAASARDQVAAVSARISELEAMAATRRGAIETHDAAIARLQEEDAAVRASLEGLDDAVRAAEERVGALRAERAERQAETDRAASALAATRADLESAAALRTKAEVAMAESRAERRNLEEGLAKDWNLTFDELRREEPPDWGDREPPTAEEAAAMVSDLRRKMENLGPVNLVAIEDCQQSEERLDFLVGQEADLLSAKEKLLALVKDIDKQSVARFKETFAKANENFQSMYTRLFGGGTAELRLLDGDDVLESGIDIVARPPGKKPTNVSLLSGGERTMTAVALLFSIYEIKPSPFAILDELDAALDDSNIGRFVDVLKDFLSLSQFLIITHNQHTIAGSDIVYGVTQREKGVSQIISMRLKRMGVEAPKGEELPELSVPKGPSERKLRNAENYVKKPRKPKSPVATEGQPAADGAAATEGQPAADGPA